MKFIIKIILTSIAVLLAAYLVPGFIVDSLTTALVVTIVLGIVNLVVRPILFILTLPITILTLGLFAFVLNALLLWFVASIVRGFSLEGFIPALLGSLLISLVSAIGHKLLR